MKTSTTNKKQRAEEKVKELKAFYNHLGVYLTVNTFITAVQVFGHMSDGASFSEALFNFGTFAVWFFWGIGLVGHALKTFSYNPFFGKDWEKRQIEKYMDEQRTEVEKYKELGDGRY